mgnify:CR=1 FL=1
MKISSPPEVTRGFSLIEVTIAMAIAAVALVTLMGLIPQGMNTMKEAGDRAIMGRIHQQVMSELQMADFDALDTFHEMEIFYDDQGEEMSDSKNQSVPLERKKGAFAHIYSARISIPGIGGEMPESVGKADFDGFSFVGSPGSPDKNLFVRPVVIEVAAVGGLAEDFKWDEEDNRRMIHTYQTNVVKMGKTFSTNAP